MIEAAIIGQKKQAGGVMIKPSNRLHVSPAELLWQQAHHPGMVTGLARTFDIAGLVERDIDILTVLPVLVEQTKAKTLGFIA